MTVTRGTLGLRNISNPTGWMQRIKAPDPYSHSCYSLDDNVFNYRVYKGTIIARIFSGNRKSRFKYTKGIHVDLK
jgi:hypothetical protein